MIFQSNQYIPNAGRWNACAIEWKKCTRAIHDTIFVSYSMKLNIQEKSNVNQKISPMLSKTHFVKIIIYALLPGIVKASLHLFKSVKIIANTIKWKCFCLTKKNA